MGDPIDLRSNNRIHLDKYSKRWSDILLGNQFLKLYFYENGISSSLIVDRMIRAHDLRVKKPNEDFKFAIIRSKPNEKNIDLDNNNDSEDKKFSYSRHDYESYEKAFEENEFLFFSKIKNYFPVNKYDFEYKHQNSKIKYTFEEDRVLNLNTEKLIQLAYSGFFNLYNSKESYNETHFFERENTPILNFFEKMKSFLKSKPEKENLIKNFHLHENERSRSRLNKAQNLSLVALQSNYRSTDQELYRNPLDNLINLNNNNANSLQKNDKNYFNQEIISHYAEKILRLEMSEAHQNAVLSIRGENSNPLFSNNDCSGNYSLFFIRSETLWEWREFSGELLKVGRNIKPEFAKDVIYDHIKTKNTESEIYYEDDVTIFAELTDRPLENIEANSKNCTLLLILTLIFLINFFVIFPQKAFFDIRQSMSKDIEKFILDPSEKEKLQTVTNFENVGNAFIEQWFNIIYAIATPENSNSTNSTTNSNNNTKTSSTKNSINYITDDTKSKLLAQNLGVMPQFNLSEVNRSIYINDINLFSGMLISFEFLQTTTVKSATGANYSNIPKSNLYYYGVIEEMETKLSFQGEGTSANLIPVYESQRRQYEIYCPPLLGEAEIKSLRKNILNAFEKQLYKFTVTSMFFNIDYNTLYSFNLELKYNAFSMLENELFFKAMMPFIKFSTGTFVLIIILSILFILGMVYLGFGHISIFMSSILDSINTKSNQLKFEELFDLSIILLNLISQIYFMVLFIFPSTIFPLKTTSKDEFIFWQDKLEAINGYQKLTGVAIFFMIMRLLKFIMVAFPSFGIVFQTLKFAYKEILAFFLLVCLMLSGIGSLAHASFGYYAKYYVDLSWAYFQVYLMFVGVFDYKSISNSEFTNSLAPVFFVVFMIIFNLILINLFISIILSNYREVKEKFQNFNNVYSIMVQEKIEELTTKLWDLLIFKHPQQVEYEMKLKKEKNNRLMHAKNKAQKVNLNLNSNNNNNLDIENFNDSKNKKYLNSAGDEIGDSNNDRISKPKLSEIGLLEKLKYNFNRLNLKQMILGEGWNKEEFNAKKIELLQKMEIINLEETIKEYSIDYDNEFWHLKKTIFYVFYIVIFIFMMDYQLRLNKNSPIKYDFDLIFGGHFEPRYKSFLDIEAPVFNFVNQFYDEKVINSTGASRKKNNRRSMDDLNHFKSKRQLSESINFSDESINNENSENKFSHKKSDQINYSSISNRNLQITNSTNQTTNKIDNNKTSSNVSTSTNNTNNSSNNISTNDNTSEANSNTPHKFNVNFAISDCSTQINQIKYRNYIALNYPFFRFTFRLFSVGVNPDQNTLSLFPFIKSSSELLDKSNCAQVTDGEFTSALNYMEAITKYSPPGNFDSAFDCGGFVFKVGKFGLGCNEEQDTLIAERMDEIFKKPNLNSVYLEFPLFNLFDDYAVLTNLSFEKNKIGEIIYTGRFDVIPINRYVSSNDFVRTILECLFFIISVSYMLFILGNIFRYFMESFQNDFEQDENKENFKDSFFLNKFFRINFNKFKNESLVKSLCDMISTIVMKLLKAIFWLLESLFSYLRSDGYNILDFIYFIITIAMIFAWYSILSDTNSLNFAQTKTMDEAASIGSVENVRVLSKLRDEYNTYFLFQAINGFILFLRILGVFKFSQSINNLMTVIYRAKQVVIFHVFSMVFFNVGFCLAGYAMFSQNLKEFSTLPYSFLQVLIIVGGNVNMDLFIDESPVFSVFFILFITFSNYLILLNILLSIVVHTFYDVKNENKINFGDKIEEDFITKIYDIIYKKILLIFERIEVYFYSALYFDKLANEKISQFKNEMNERNIKSESAAEDKKASLDNKSKILSNYELYSNLRNQIEKLSIKAEKCEFTQEKGDDKNPAQDTNRSNVFLSNSKQKTPPKITILEKIFTYMYIVLFEEVPNTNYLFSKTEETKVIRSENPFYSKRFENDSSDLPKDEDIVKINNLYIGNFVSKLKQDIVKKPNSFFSNNYYKKIKKYLASTESLRQKKGAKKKLKKLNFQLCYAKKCRDPLENFDNLLYPDDLYKVGKTAFNKILNIIIFTEKTKIKNPNHFNVAELCKLKKESEISFNDNFNDVLGEKAKLLKYLKLASMTYDLIVKHYYMPKEFKLEEKNAYLGFYLQKFLERQFNQIEIQYLNQNIPEIKDSLFENDILKLLQFDFDVYHSNYIEGQIETYISDEQLSIRNEAFSDENDLDEFVQKHKRPNINDNKITNFNNINMNNNIRKYNTNYNSNYNNNKNLNDTANHNPNNQTQVNANNKSGFNNANLTYDLTGNYNNPKDLNTKSVKDHGIFDSSSREITEENVEFLPSFKERCLKIFTIWNTLFIILFRKNFKYLKFLENLSFSKQLIKQYEEKFKFKDFDKNDICFKSSFLYLFSRLFFLEQPLKKDALVNNNQVNNNNIKQTNGTNFVFKKIDKNIKKLNEVRLLGKLDENDITSPMTTFYAHINEYLFDTPDEDFEKNIKEEGQKSINSYRATEKFSSFYPGIFAKIWSSLDESAKKVLFFGLNEYNYESIAKNDLSVFMKLAFYEDLIDNIHRREGLFDEDNKVVLDQSEKDHRNNNNNNNNNNFFVEKNKEHEDETKSSKYRDLKIIPFFRSEQRSHIFNYLKFPSEKFDECKKAILALPTKGITSDDIDRYKNFENLFKFINESKFSLKYIYDVYNAIFDKLFKDIKIKLKDVSNEFEKILALLIKDNKDFFNVAKNRIKFIKFFRYVLAMKKYETIKNCIIESSSKGNSNGYIEKEYLDNLIKDSELIIFVLSLPPMDLIEIIRKCENEEIRETFTFLFIYIYSGTKEFQNSIKYLKKFVKSELTVKYDKYGKLLEVKEKMKAFEDKISNDHKKFSNMQEYKKELDEKIRELMKVRDNTLNELEKKVILNAVTEQEEEES